MAITLRVGWAVFGISHFEESISDTIVRGSTGVQLASSKVITYVKMELKERRVANLLINTGKKGIKRCWQS